MQYDSSHGFYAVTARAHVYCSCSSDRALVQQLADHKDWGQMPVCVALVLFCIDAAGLFKDALENGAMQGKTFKSHSVRLVDQFEALPFEVGIMIASQDRQQTKCKITIFEVLCKHMGLWGCVYVRSMQGNGKESSKTARQH